VKPFIIKHPENISIVAGEEIRLGCVVGGRPPPEIRWWRQNGQLPANRVLVSDNSVLTVRNVIPDDEDVYVCQAENNVGSVQALANVQIHCKLFFKNYQCYCGTELIKVEKARFKIS
jgi:roundabout axon guidance receptor 2